MSVEIRAVTPADPALLEEWTDVYQRADRHERDTATPWTFAEVKAAMEQPDPRYGHADLAGMVDGRVVATGSMSWPLRDNPEAAFLQVYVDPPARRRGFGRAMLAALEERSVGLGRRLLLGEAAWPYEYGAEGQGWPGTEFARAHGYALALGEVQRRLLLPVGVALLDRLHAEAAPHLEGYTLRSFTGPVPEDLLEAYTVLDSAVDTEAPTGELAIEPTRPDPEAVRAQNELLAAQRRTRCATFAFRGDEPAAYTEIMVVGHEPGRSYQWGTLVRREHRGRRLGLATKVANLRVLQQEFPEVTHVLTWNAEANAHMIGINAAMGFERVGRMGEFQKRAG